MVARLALNVAAVLFAALALAAAACTDALPTDPTPMTRLPAGQTGQSGGDAADPAAAGSLAGEWEALLVFEVPGDIVTTRTRWRFGGDGTCRRTVTSLSAVEGVPLISARDCTFAIAAAAIVVSYDDGEIARFDLSLLELPDTIVLDGLAYQRVG